ncbi:MAG: DUF58 domain-containing protein [Planctomycetaceae bacterium]
MPRLPNESIDARTLMRIRSLELRAKGVVEGFLSGLHRSPYHGFSVEFTEYREYVPGDDPRFVDWRLVARTDRYYVKRFEDETNLRCHLLVDTSRSMSFGTQGYSKADYARTLAATLAYFLTLQRDAVGLALFDAEVEEYLPARYRPGQMRRLMLALEQPSAGTATDLVRPLDQLAERLGKRGLLVLVSDLLAPIDQLQRQLGYLRARGHEIAIFQTLDPAELTLDFDEPALFHDLESGQDIYVDPTETRADYSARLEAHLAGIRHCCDSLGIDYRLTETSAPLDRALGDFLQTRGRVATRRGRSRG